jgi:hypothetical protein
MTHHRAATLAALLARHYPDAPLLAVISTVEALRTAARSALNYELRRCNSGMSERGEEAWRQRLDREEARLNDTLTHSLLRSPAYDGDRGPLHNQPVTVKLGGDPRGPCAYLTVPGQHGDSGGCGYAVY